MIRKKQARGLDPGVDAGFCENIMRKKMIEPVDAAPIPPIMIGQGAQAASRDLFAGIAGVGEAGA